MGVLAGFFLDFVFLPYFCGENTALSPRKEVTRRIEARKEEKVARKEKREKNKAVDHKRPVTRAGRTGILPPKDHTQKHDLVIGKKGKCREDHGVAPKGGGKVKVKERAGGARHPAGGAIEPEHQPRAFPEDVKNVTAIEKKKDKSRGKESKMPSKIEEEVLFIRFLTHFSFLL